MLSDEVINRVIERLVLRIEEGNSYVLEQIGKSIKKIGVLSPSKAQQLGQIIKYGGDYDKITKKLAQITELNIKDIYEIFDEVAQSDYQFAKQFYDYRGIKYIPYEENHALQNQVKAIASITAGQYLNMAHTLAFTKKINGKIIYTPLARAYQEALDKAILNVIQGKNAFQEEMYKTIKELGSSGLKTVNYSTGKSLRLDTAVRMNMQTALRDLRYEMQKQYGEQFKYDGYELTAHINPAPDHEEAQGRQYSIKEYNKLQSDGVAHDYTGKEIDMRTKYGHRRIREYNCQHYEFPIILGVSKPEYTAEQLQEIIDNNHEGFELDGKHYTNYEGTQLQRQLETAIRKEKDKQIIAKASYNEAKPEENYKFKQAIDESQKKITQLTKKYRELSEKSGLPTRMQRMRVPGYRRVAKSKLK